MNSKKITSKPAHLCSDVLSEHKVSRQTTAQFAHLPLGSEQVSTPKVSRTRKNLQLVKYSENRRRIGETAPGAKLTDAEVEIIRTLHEGYSLVCAAG